MPVCPQHAALPPAAFLLSADVDALLFLVPQIRHAAEGDVKEAAKDVGSMAKNAAKVGVACWCL